MGLRSALSLHGDEGKGRKARRPRGAEVRGIPADPVVLRQDWLAAYNYVTDKGALALNDYARSNDPFSKVGKTQISVEVASVIRA